MSENNRTYIKNIINSIDEAYAHHKLILDDNNKPCDYVFLDVNEPFERLTGLLKKDIIGKSIKSVYPVVEEFWIEQYGKVTLNNEKKKFVHYEKNMGKYFEVIAFSDGDLEFTTIFIDVTQTNEKNELLQKYNLLEKSSRDIIMFVSIEGIIIDANQAAINSYGYDYKELLKLSIKDIREDIESELIKHQLKEAIDKGIRFETNHIRKNGERFPVEVNSFKGEIAGKPLIVSVIRDISERKKLEKELWIRANHDYLTEIYNRHFLMGELQLAVERAKREDEKLAILYFDIDNFKMINDIYGHEWGDVVLKETADRILGVVRKSDVFARMGGDEFVIIQEMRKTSDSWNKLIDRISKVMIDPFKIDGEDIDITVSIGVCMYPNDGDTTNMLLSNADSAMYAAKKEVGISFVLFDSL